MKRRPI